jgi:adenosylcobyric acid synthase
MLGRTIIDPAGVESSGRSARGLGLIAGDTELAQEKLTRTVWATTARGVRFRGYEIHLGVTTLDPSAGMPPFATLDDGAADGARGPRVVGTYLHGALEDAAVASELFGIDVPSGPSRARHYQQMAVWFERHATNLDALGF